MLFVNFSVLNQVALASSLRTNALEACQTSM